MDWSKVIIFILAYLFVAVILALAVPPFIEDKSYPCVFKNDNICHYPEIWNPQYFYIFGLISIIFIVISLVTFGDQEKTAYIMSLPEALNKICMANRLFYKIPPLSLFKYDMIRPLDGGKRMIVVYQNPLDKYRTHTMILNMMSDYATSTSDTKQIDPIIGATRVPLSLSGMRQFLYTQEKSLASQLASLDRRLERQNIGSGLTQELLEEDIQKKKESLRLKGVMG